MRTDVPSTTDDQNIHEVDFLKRFGSNNDEGDQEGSIAGRACRQTAPYQADTRTRSPHQRYVFNSSSIGTMRSRGETTNQASNDAGSVGTARKIVANSRVDCQVTSWTTCKRRVSSRPKYHRCVSDVIWQTIYRLARKTPATGSKIQVGDLTEFMGVAARSRSNSPPHRFRAPWLPSAPSLNSYSSKAIVTENPAELLAAAKTVAAYARRSVAS